jgi:hypothetical protein
MCVQASIFPSTKRLMNDLSTTVVHYGLYIYKLDFQQLSNVCMYSSPLYVRRHVCQDEWPPKCDLKPESKAATEKERRFFQNLIIQTMPIDSMYVCIMYPFHIEY